MNTTTEVQQTQSGLALSELELLDVLQVSIYPGAARPSIKLAIAYCRANNLDIFQKPVHIVPMWDKNARAMRDVIMPGVGLYRTQAARSGAWSGITEPEFGPSVDIQLGGTHFNVPEWCRVTARRIMPNGAIAEFTAKEFWIENYATAGKDNEQPNAMWKKRPRGQLGKCAQAQALRLAFPEMVSAAPTADEMEGKSLEGADDNGIKDINPRQSQQRVTPQSLAAAKAAEAPTGPSPELLDKIRFAADQGIAAFDIAWKKISGAERAAVRASGELADLKERCARSDACARSGAYVNAETVEARDVPPQATQDHSDFVSAMDQAEAAHG